MSLPFPETPTAAFPYRIEKQAGSGAMGVVYHAVDVTLDRAVAIKVLKASDDSESPEQSQEKRKRFLQEARAAAVLSHPGVTTVHRIGELGETPFIVMEWLGGATLEQVLEKEPRLSLERASRIILDLLETLAFAHREGVVHRDLKPSNLVLLEDGRLKVADFGIALLQGRKVVETVAGTVLATPQFASPEQLEGGKIDGRADLFATGVLFYHLLTGAMPFEGKTLIELITAVLHREPVALGERWSGAPPAIERFFVKALAKNVDARFERAEDMAAALRQAIAPPAPSQATGLDLERTTRMMAPPLEIFTSSEAGAVQGALSWAETWGRQEAGVQDRATLISKLLESPLHARPFAGVAHLGDHALLVEDGIVLAAVSSDGKVADRDIELIERGAASLNTLPATYQPGVVALLASILHLAPVRQGNLDSQVVDLGALAGKLLEGGFTGYMRLEQGGSEAWILLRDSASELALFTGSWPEEPQDKDWHRWLAGTDVTATVVDHSIEPPYFWYRWAFPDTRVSIAASIPEGSKSSSGTVALADVMAHRSAPALWRATPRFDDIEYRGKPLTGSSILPVARFMFNDLPRMLMERRIGASWKYLGDWLLQVSTLRFFPTEEDLAGFGLVSEDPGGKILHLAARYATVDAEVFERFISLAAAAKQARAKRGDVGGVLLVAKTFTEDALAAYRKLLHQGLGNKLFGIDKSMGYEGFVRLSARRGYHLLLVEETHDGLVPLFEV